MLSLLGLVSSCGVYRQDVMFRYDEGFNESNLAFASSQAFENYKIRIDDRFEFDLFTNEGELIIDPNFELSRQLGAGQLNNQNLAFDQNMTYQVLQDSTLRLPLIGEVNLVGMTLNDARYYLEDKFDEYYEGSYVTLNYLNNRVIVLGANGGQIIPLSNEKTSLLEIIALAGGLQSGSKSHNIKLIRGDLSDPKVYQIDLSTVSGMKSTIVSVEPNDVIYIEPWRRPVKETLEEINSYLRLVTGTVSVIITYLLLEDRLNNQN